MRRGAVVGAVLIGAVAVAGGTWVVASQVMRSPADIAAATAAPTPSLVTVPVREQELVADIIVRGTMRFQEPLVVTLRGTPAIDGEPVVTQVPDEGVEVASGDVLLQVSGRPIFLLEGELPAYRDLRPGSTGDDVAQLQRALSALGHDTGGTDGEFGASTQEAVAALYEDAGHVAPGPSADELDRLAAERDRMRAAREQVEEAERMLQQAGRGPSRTELLQAEAAVNDARDQVELAEDATARRRAEDQLAIAQAQLDELRADPDTSAESRALSSARDELSAAQAALSELEAAVGTWLPAGEVVYLTGLPQRIDDVAVRLGDPATGELLTMTTPEIVIESSVRAVDIDLVHVGNQVLIDDDSGTELTGTIVEVASSPDRDGTDGRYAILIEPDEPADDLLGFSLRIRIPVSSTDGPVLTVPIAALSARADGTSVVEVVDDAVGNQRLVTVEPGLTADGLVEVVPIDGELADGDQVVVSGGGDPDRATADAEEAEEAEEA